MNSLVNIKMNKLSVARAAIMAVPTYTVALMTEQMFYVVPTIAMMLLIANAVELASPKIENRIDDNDGSLEQVEQNSLSDADGFGDVDGGF